MRQEQFLRVCSRDEAERRFREAVEFEPLGGEPCALDAALGRVAATDVAAPLDVPGFARADRDGFALRAADTFGAAEEAPCRLRLAGAPVATGVRPDHAVEPGAATAVATGAILPRGADSVVMVEDTDVEGGRLLVRRAVVPGAHVSQAGSDIARGETVVRAGSVLSSRETGLLAALGLAGVEVVRRPRVFLFSTGDEVVAPGRALRDGEIYDSNARILADAVRECGGEPIEGGIVRDDEAALARAFERGLSEADLVLLSGGTSKGAGDLSHRVVAERAQVLVHGVALKPGKPLLLAVAGGQPVAILPGFPTSAVFTFHEFIAPWVRARAGRPPQAPSVVAATLPRAIVSDRGRTEYDLVHLIRGRDGLVAWPLGKGSGSLSTFARADGFHAIPAEVERLEAGDAVEVTLLGPLRLPDLVVIGSHDTRLDALLAELRAGGIPSKVIAAGSRAGLEAARRGECDLAGIHLLDEKSGEYNTPFVTDELLLVRGYARRQGVVSRDGTRGGRLVNRNRGSGTRVLIDRLLDGARPDGYDYEVRSHAAVAAAVASGRADWGVCIEAAAGDLHFDFLADEQFDFVVRKDRADRPAVRAFLDRLVEG